MMLFPRYDGAALIEQICGVENLTLAWRRVRSNIQIARRGRSAGPDAVTVRDFEADWTRQMTQLAEELRAGTYRPLPPRRVAIPKASGGERAIAILAVRDRIAQRAVQQVLEPLFEPLFLDCSYGCRPRVGVHEAVARVARYADQGLTWVVDADVVSYFDTIDQRILLGLLRQRIDDVAVLRLIAQWLTSGALADSEAPLVASNGALDALGRGGQALQRWLAWATPEPPPVPDPRDPYAAGGWEQPGGALMSNNLGTALLLARPALSAARTALPYVQRIARQVGGQRALLIGALAAGGAVAAGELARRARGEAARGTPQGGALSPLLANIYLHPFDLALTSQGMRLVRFMDDFVIMCASREEAERALQLATRQLATLRLALNEAKTSVGCYADGLEFLGQALAPRRGGPRLEHGLVSFDEAQQALRKAAGSVRQQVRRIKR
jgi:RNA-directed DNA polymerase